MKDIQATDEYSKNKDENKTKDVPEKSVYVKPKVVRVRRILAAGGHKV